MAVTKRHPLTRFALVLAACISPLVGHAAVVPEDRIDILYHSYEGGGMSIDGPSVLVRKSVGSNVSVWGNYYEDWISAASVDVVTQGSAYEEERQEASVGTNLVYQKTQFGLSFTKSDENDYDASAVAGSISQDFFGDLTTLSLSYSQGNDQVKRNERDPDSGNVIGATHVGDAKHQRFGLSLNQVVSRNMIVAVAAESVIDEGFLNNPYRSVRYAVNDSQRSAPERYPNTRVSDALAFRTMYYLPYRAAIKGEIRAFNDSWGIRGNNVEVRYTHPIRHFIFEGKFRHYSQTKADFFADMFTQAEINNNTFLASDKELDAMRNTSIGLGVSYDIQSKYLSFFDRSSVNFYWDWMLFDYDNYRDRRQSQDNIDNEKVAYGEEELYTFNAHVVRLFFSFWY